MKMKGNKITRWTGVVIFLVGIILLSAISIFPLYSPDVEESDMLFGVRFGMGLLIIGGVIIFIDICIERYRDHLEMKEKISKEDL
ncbi:MAG: hypothetical protein SVM80_03960, partial [Halobacteriota archaeon]|nr:hypothetical protein [Halobacteriota archaeon]